MKLQIILFTLLQSCATVLSGTSQTINVKVIDSASSEMLNGFSCVLLDASGADLTFNQNPVKLKIKQGPSLDHMKITCTKQGYTQLNTSVGTSFNSVSLFNLFFLPGFIVDFATGAYKKVPSHYVVSMQKM